LIFWKSPISSRSLILPFANNRGSDSTLSMGWLNEADNTPIDLTDYGRNRPPSPDIDIYRETFVHMDHPGENQAAKWELAVPNGTYRILVQVGDSSTENGNGARHLLRAEGVTLTEFTRNAGVFGVKNGTAVVTVSDGRLTLDQSGGSNTKLHLVIVESSSGPNTPAVLGSTPSDGATNVSVNTTISANMLHLPNVSNNGATSLDNGTINTTNVRLFEVTSGGDVGVSTTVNGTGGGDAINLTPASPLKANTRYRYVIENVKDLAGATLLPFSMEFITGSGDSEPSSGSLDNVAFEKVGQQWYIEQPPSSDNLDGCLWRPPSHWIGLCTQCNSKQSGRLCHPFDVDLFWRASLGRSALSSQWGQSTKCRVAGDQPAPFCA